MNQRQMPCIQVLFNGAINPTIYAAKSNQDAVRFAAHDIATWLDPVEQKDLLYGGEYEEFILANGFDYTYDTVYLTDEPHTLQELLEYDKHRHAQQLLELARKGANSEADKQLLSELEETYDLNSTRT